MRYTSFHIKNYKGIKNLKLDLNKKPWHPVHTLVGLNESGKTTILEALHWFYEPTPYEAHDLIPRAHQANFDGEISVEATLELDGDDHRELEKHFIKARFKVSTLPNEVVVKRKFNYKDSVPTTESSQTTWILEIFGKAKGGRKERKLGSHKELWQATVHFIRVYMLPPLIYYENFLFDIPDKIYLEGPACEDREQAEYRSVIQDVLTALNSKLDVQKHLVDRFHSNKKQDRDNIRAVLNRAEAHMTKVVVRGWRDIVRMAERDLSITLGGQLGQDEGGVFLELMVKEDASTFYIRDRSLGFRWFIGFILFTHFRTYRDEARREAVFLLDEPASNLHPAAQTELLKAFEDLTQKQIVIYSTHSHHMIRPEWLGNTFVVKNEAMDYRDLGLGFQAQLTEIGAVRYFPFVSQYPDDTDLYRPILDALDYRPSQLEMVPEIVVVEGKNDYYALKLFAREVLGDADRFRIYPSTGKDKTQYVAGLYLAWGRDFIVLLDADTGGRGTARRLKKAFGSVVDDRVFDLTDVAASWDGKDMEALIDERDQKKLVKSEFPDDPAVTKSKLNTAIQAALIQHQPVAFNKLTMGRVKKLLAFIEEKVPK